MVADIAKVDTELGIVYGWANVAQVGDTVVVDYQDDVIPASELEKAVATFMVEHRASGAMHQGDATGVVVESMVMSPEKAEAMGFPPAIAKQMPTAWWIGVKPDADTLAKAKAGQFRMFSIQGRAVREAV